MTTYRFRSASGDVDLELSPSVSSASGRAADPIYLLDVEDPEVVHDLAEGQSNLVGGYQPSFTSDPLRALAQLGSFYTGEGWRGYRGYIGTPILYATYSEETKTSLLQSTTIKRRVRVLAERQLDRLAITDERERSERMKILLNQLEDVVKVEIDKLIARLDSISFLKTFAVSVQNGLSRIYDNGIFISLPEVEMLRRAAAQAAENKQSLILLPCHKSHIDYLTISWLMFRLGLAVPHIVAGENLDLPVLGSILRRGGAFFIRRKFGEDQLYPVLVREYIEQLLEKGHNIECFIEGGRSRTGKLLSPKLGILGYILEAVLKGRTQDALICPISVQYDKVIEASSYSRELLGQEKEAESLAKLFSKRAVLGLKLGRIDVRFSEPWSLRAFLDEHAASRNAFRSEDAPQFDVSRSEGDRVALLRALAYRVLGDINAASVVMPAALVGTVLLTLRGRGVGKSELMRRVDWIKSEILRKGGRVAAFGKPTEEVVDRTLVVLKDLIGVRDDLFETTYFALKRFELSYLRNQVVHHFVQEALLSATLYTRVKAGGPAPSQRISREVILSESGFLSSLLKDEFIYPTAPLEVNVNQTIEALNSDGVITISDGLVGLSDQEREAGRERFDFFLFLIWPFIEGYWLAAVSLFALLGEETPTELLWVSEKDFSTRIQAFAKTLYYQGDLSYLEAVNTATLSNALARLQAMGVLLSRRSTKLKKSTALIALNPEWDRERIWGFVERLGTFRREGKNRRDSATVSTRVLGLAQQISPPVLEREPWGAQAEQARL